MPEFDHIVIAAETLAEGEEFLTALLRTAPEPGGRHDFMGTYNRLWRMGPGEYIELIAIDPDAPAPSFPRWFGLDGFSGAPRLVSWVCRTERLNTAKGSKIMDAARGLLRWRITIPDSGVSECDGLAPLMIDWQGSAHPADRMPDHGFRLLGLNLTHPQPPKLNMKDPRISVAQGDAALVAHISTPHGKITL
ncbi:VOC family protein [Paracoccus aerodenitrificans]|uniref:VOC family protein n=1 Tax=Paracoccus aerodenitrificans TaxID=3017781 RepID=UPI0022EFFF5F|nr:VOC family protein [Paracoccus aerodenitrificans]WBU62840.1 VOC family protein [Paracoccus aerodenitrificans]